MTKEKKMRPYVAVDIETTGLDPDECDIVEIGAVIENWRDPIGELPKFHCYVERLSYIGEPYALSMHQAIFRRIAKHEDGFMYLKPGHVARELGRWILQHDGRAGRTYITFAGKNFSAFDLRFLRRLPDWGKHIKHQNRVIDPAMLYWRPEEDERGLPDQATCLARAGLPATVTHTALEDALQVTALVRAWREQAE